jgi:transmembrane sensor
VTTGVGEVRRLGLADGSALAVDARSSLHVDVARGGRREVAMEAGRALFRVTHDAAHPFQVVAGADDHRRGHRV